MFAVFGTEFVVTAVACGLFSVFPVDWTLLLPAFPFAAPPLALDNQLAVPLVAVLPPLSFTAPLVAAPLPFAVPLLGTPLVAPLAALGAPLDGPLVALGAPLVLVIPLPLFAPLVEPLV